MIGGIFVGGSSSRMGTPKGLLRTRDGELLAERLARVIREAGLRPVLVGRRPEYASLDLETLDDSPIARGPLAGLISLLRAAKGESVVAIACDMPFVGPELLRKLVTAPPAPVVAARRERWEPLFARYDASRVLDVAMEHARREKHSLQALLDAAGAEALDLNLVEQHELVDWDMPEDREAQRSDPSFSGGLGGGAPHREDVAASPTLARATSVRDVVYVREHDVTSGSDRIAVEEPLEIRAGRTPIAVTMRTPGADCDLAVGFLLGEGIVRTQADVHAVSPAGPNAVVLDLGGDALGRLERRRFWVTSSCGICGKESIDRIRAEIPSVTHRVTVSHEVIRRAPEALRERQALFDHTGGLHAAGLFSREGELLRAAEDVGRHNALDKVLGAELLAGRLPLHDRIVALSGRIAFELVQKAALASVPVIVAVGAPTSLAVELAEEVGITLVGFARGGRFNVYSRRASVVP